MWFASTCGLSIACPDRNGLAYTQDMPSNAQAEVLHKLTFALAAHLTLWKTRYFTRYDWHGAHLNSQPEKEKSMDFSNFLWLSWSHPTTKLTTSIISVHPMLSKPWNLPQHLSVNENSNAAILGRLKWDRKWETRPGDPLTSPIAKGSKTCTSIRSRWSNGMFNS